MPTGKQIMEAAAPILNDEDNVRWPLPERAAAINEAVKAIILAKPSASSKSRLINLAEGTFQQVPTNGATPPLQLLDITRNIVSADPLQAGRKITPASRNDLDALEPNWHDTRFVRFRREARHFTFDERNPLEFYVYPGNDGNGIVEALTSDLPTPLTASGDPNDIESYTADLGLPEPYSVPILDYMLHHLFQKDDLQSSPVRATFHFEKYAAAIGLKVDVERTRSPNIRRGGN